MSSTAYYVLISNQYLLKLCGQLVDFVFQDNFETHHSITIIEKFEIKEPLKILKEGFLYLYPAEMYRALKMLESEERLSPVDLHYPAKITHKIIIHTPTQLEATPAQECEHICDAVVFKRSYQQAGTQITIENNLETKQLFIWPAAVKEYCQVSKAIWDDYCYVNQETLELKHPKTFIEKLKSIFSFKNDKFRDSVIWFGVGLVLVWCWFGVGLVLVWCWFGVGLGAFLVRLYVGK